MSGEKATCTPDSDPAATEPAAEAPAAVLIVDDEPSVLRSLQRALRRGGYNVLLAEDGQTALDTLSHHEIAVLICDQRMPGMSGPEVLEKARAISPDTARITLTGHSDTEGLAASINQGRVQHFLLKPWDDEHLGVVVAEAVKSLQLKKDHARLVALTRQQNERLEQWNKQLADQVHERTTELRRNNETLEALQRQIEDSLRDTVGVLAGMLEAYSPNLGIHSKRVAQLAREIGAQLGLSEAEARDLEFAAYLHDVGKLSRIYLSQRERAAHPGVRHAPPTSHHPEVGSGLLSRVRGFEHVARAVRHQHEWYSGSGKPDGLSGDHIPLASRLISVVNAYDKAVYPKHDPTAIAPQAGKHVLLRGKGDQFDPTIVQMLLNFVAAMGGAGADESEVEVAPDHLRPGMRVARALYNDNGNVLLLKAGTELNDELIQRIRSMRQGNMLLTGVFVHGCSPGLVDAQPDSDAETVPSDAAPHSPGPLPATGRPPAPALPTGGSAGPGRPDAARSRTPALRAHHTPPVPRPLKVLIVDDAILVCNALKRELRPLGVDAVASNDPRTALHLATTDDFQVIIVDLMMPTMHGDEFVRRMQDVAPEVPCIILTGNATREHVVQLMKQPNVARILTKPWDRARLVDAINEAVGRGEAALGAGRP